MMCLKNQHRCGIKYPCRTCNPQTWRVSSRGRTEAFLPQRALNFFFFSHPPSLSIEEKKQNTSPSFPCLLRLMLITVLLEWRQIYGENEYVHTGSNWPRPYWIKLTTWRWQTKWEAYGKGSPQLLDPLTWTESMRMKPINEFKSHLCWNSTLQLAANRRPDGVRGNPLGRRAAWP